MKVLTILLSFFISIFASTANAQVLKKIEGNDKYINIEHKVNDFHKVTFNHSFNITYHQNPDSAGIVRVYGEENILKNLGVDSQKGKLTLKLSNLNKTDYGVILIHIYSTNLNEVDNNGNGVFEIQGKLESPELKLYITGNGQVKAENVDCGVVKAKVMAGSGDILLKGKSGYSDFNIMGSGEIRSEDLVSNEVSAVITGNGSIGCHAVKNLKTFLTGSGRVYYRGEPEMKNRTIGTGQVKAIK